MLFARTVNNFYACVFFAYPVYIFVRKKDRPKGIFRRPPLQTGGEQAKRNILTPYFFAKNVLSIYVQKVGASKLFTLKGVRRNIPFGLK
jgi:hypothetical protein